MPRSAAIGQLNGSIDPRLSSHLPSNTDSAAMAIASPMSREGLEDLRKLPAASATAAWARSKARIPRNARTSASSTPGLVAGNRRLPAETLMPTTVPSLQSTGISRFTRPNRGAILDSWALVCGGGPQVQHKSTPCRAKGMCSHENLPNRQNLNGEWPEHPKERRL